MPRPRSPALRGLLVLLALVAAALAWRALPVSDWVDQFLRPAVERAGPAGYAVYFAAYVAAVVLMVPGSALTLAGGYLFGPLAGALLAWSSATVGAALAFLIARHAARDRVRRGIGDDRRFRAVDRAVADRGARVGCCSGSRRSPRSTC